MKRTIAMLLAVVLFYGCAENKTVDPGTNTVNDTVTQDPDSNVINVSNDTVKDELAAEPTPANKGGTHPVSLHWLDWERPGKASVIPMENDWYKISGSQNRGKDGYLKIEGRIRRISKKELEFDGIIETRTNITNNGQPCIKKGKQIFFAKGSRTYYRLQNMENCEGGNLVDYVDIFPGTSSL